MLRGVFVGIRDLCVLGKERRRQDQHQHSHGPDKEHGIFGSELRQLPDPAVFLRRVTDGPVQPLGAADKGHEEIAEAVEGVPKCAEHQNQSGKCGFFYLQCAFIEQMRINHQDNQCKRPADQTLHIIPGPVTVAHGIEVERIAHDTGQFEEDPARGESCARKAQQAFAKAEVLRFRLPAAGNQQKQNKGKGEPHDDRVDHMVPMARNDEIRCIFEISKHQ